MSPVPCYNCNGINRIWQTGVELLGCVLCKSYGDGKGQIDCTARHKKIEIEGMIFKPPSYECVFCKDTGKVTEKVWIEELKVPNYSDNGWCIMPYKTMECSNCKK